MIQSKIQQFFASVTTISISTGMPDGSEPIPTAELGCFTWELEDEMHPSWKVLAHQTKIPIAAGENIAERNDSQPPLAI